MVAFMKKEEVDILKFQRPPSFASFEIRVRVLTKGKGGTNEILQENFTS